jgi:hypothetical protein
MHDRGITPDQVIAVLREPSVMHRDEKHCSWVVMRGGIKLVLNDDHSALITCAWTPTH